jgi:hypothetical protein
LRFDSLVVEGRAVNLLQRTGRVKRIEMDRAGNGFLARAMLAANQHGRILEGDLADRLEHSLHPWALAHERLGSAKLGDEFRGVVGWRAQQSPQLERTFELLAQLGQINWLGQVIECPQLHRLNSRRACAARSDEQHERVGVDLAELPQHVNSQGVGQVIVEDNDLWTQAARGLDAGSSCVRTHDLRAEPFGCLFDDERYHRVVVDDDDRRSEIRPFDRWYLSLRRAAGLGRYRGGAHGPDGG